MRIDFKTISWWLIALLVLCSLPSLAQERTGSVSGTVTDQSAAVIRGAVVMLTNKDTGRTHTVTTDSSGVYHALEMAPGRYSVQFDASGFARAEIPDIIVLLGRDAQANMQMKVGGVEETLVIEAAPAVDVVSSMVVQNTTAEELERLPKPRSFQGVAVFSTSVNTGQIEGGYQVNGASSAENNYYIDGVSTTSLIDGRARQDAVTEYLQEVQVKTTGLEAEYGGALGGVISAVTKSGGNDFHGSFYYYYYGNRLSAGPTERLALDPVGETTAKYVQDTKQKSDTHEFGGSLSGPFIKDKLWFFSSISPRWQNRTNHYLFSNGTEPGEMTRSAYAMSWFNKLSWDPSNRIRTNISWLYTPQYLKGTLYAYDGFAPNVVTRSLESARQDFRRGYNQPEQSFNANVDWTTSNSSLLSVRGGRYYLNYKEVGVPFTKYWWWQASSIGLLDVPEELQQPFNYATPSGAQVVWDVTTRTYVQADYSQFVRFGGQHNFKFGIGTQKNVNNVNDSWNGTDGRALLYWDLSINGDRGKYGFYRVDDASTKGSAGAQITHIYIQDSWRIHRRLTLNLGLRTEKETIPAFQPKVAEEVLGTPYAFQFGFGDKLAPRLGASFDVLGDGKLKLYGGWGRFFDWTKYDLARGTFGGDIWKAYYRSLDTLDIFSIDLHNMPGRNLWTSEYRDRRVPGFDLLDPNVKPMSADVANLGLEWEFHPKMVFSARYVRNHLRRTIEDLGALDANGDEVYAYGNPGEGTNTIAPSSGATCIIVTNGVCGMPMPKAVRKYDALELSFIRRFSTGWLANVSYVYSRLFGNYSGLQSTDEIRPPTLGYGFGPNQVFGSENYRPGGNANRYFDLDEAFWDANGNEGLYGRLPTDRPHVLKAQGSYSFRQGTEIGGFFRVMSGTPVTTQVDSVNQIPIYVEGRGDLGRTPVFNQTDLLVAHEFKAGEGKKLRIEFNVLNLFNQKTSMFTFDRYNREEKSDSVGIDLSNTDLSKGFDWKALAVDNPDGAKALDPRFGKAAIFNPGIAARFLVKYMF